MPRVPPPSFKRKQLGRHIRFASRPARAVPPATLAHMSYVRTYPTLDVQYVRERKHSTALQHRKNNEKDTENFGKKKKTLSPHVILFCLIGTPCTGQRRKKSNSRACLSASYAARPSREHLATDSVQLKISSRSATVSPVARLALGPVLTEALVRQLDKFGAQIA